MPMPYSDHAVLLKATAQHGRLSDGRAVLCLPILLFSEVRSFLVVSPCSQVCVYRHFRRAFSLHQPDV